MIVGYRRQKKELCLHLGAWVPTKAIVQANLLVFCFETFLLLEKIILMVKTTFVESLHKRVWNLISCKKIPCG